MYEEINSHLDSLDLDIKKSNNARFMDQKVTPDVLCFIADCIINFTGGDINKEFTVKNIWTSQYFIKNIQAVFGKPSPKNIHASHEYDKFIAQPIKTLDYAKILNSRRHKQGVCYAINNLEILEYISLREKNAYDFLVYYLTKVLVDSDFYKHILAFENHYKQEKLANIHFRELKHRFQKFIIGNTPINGKTEVNRIFPKVLNIMAVSKSMPGTIAGRLSPYRFTYSDLMYNRINFRDIKKDKGLTRKESSTQKRKIKTQQKIYDNYLIRKAKLIINRKYSQSELRDAWAKGPAIHVHHIFPRRLFPRIAHYLENLIKLTAEQHFSKTHPKGNTTQVDPDYQMQCIIAKSHSIEASFRAGEFIYSKESFVFVVNTGLKTKFKVSISMEDLRKKIVQTYDELHSS